MLGEHKTAQSTGEARTIYLTPPAKEILEQARRERQTGYVFLSRLGTPYTVAGLRSILQRRSRTIRPYTLRHTFGQLGSEQMSEQDLAKLMGHSDVATTRRYFAVRDARAVANAQRLELPQLALPTGASLPPTGDAAKKQPKKGRKGTRHRVRRA